MSSNTLFVQQRTQTANTIRSHLLEFGIVFGRSFAALNEVRDALAEGSLTTPEPLPDLVTATDPDTKRYQTVPGVGPNTTFALRAFAGDLAQFKNGREFAA